jgi:hypothetical protein
MSLKTLVKTRWKIEPDRVIIYPYGLLYVFTAVIAALFTGLLLLYLKSINTTLAESLPLVLFLLLIIVLFWGFAGTYVEFDNSKARMRKMLMGFLPVTTLPLAKLQGINSVSNTVGSYNYRLFRKDARYGKGIVVSSGYTKEDDPNAIAFVNEAIPIIHSYLDRYDTPTDFVDEKITSYKYFDQEAGVYTVKNKKIGAIILGFFFVALGLYLTTIETNGFLPKLIIVAAMLLMGLVIINAGYTKLSFDTTNQIIQRTGLISYFNKQYNFYSFAGIETLRRSINFVYAGTDVNMYFEVAGKNGKQEIITASSFKNSADIERFIKELYQIMEID